MQDQLFFGKLTMKFVSSILVAFFFFCGTAAATTDCTQFGHWRKCGEIYTHATGKVYRGGFKNNRPNGLGVMEYPINSEPIYKTYDGFFADGMRHGQGSAALRNGDKYKGKWSANLRNGPGQRISNSKVFNETYDFGRLIYSIEQNVASSSVRKKDVIASQNPPKESHALQPIQSGTKTNSSPPQKKREKRTQIEDVASAIAKLKGQNTPQVSNLNTKDYPDGINSSVNKKNQNTNILYGALTILALLISIILIFPQREKNTAKSDPNVNLKKDANTISDAINLTAQSSFIDQSAKLKKAMGAAYDKALDKKSFEQDDLKASFMNSFDSKKTLRKIERKLARAEIVREEP